MTEAPFARGHQRSHDAVEREQRIVVENDGGELGGLDLRLFEAVVDGVRREARIVLLPAEPLLLCGGDNDAIADERGRGVMIERGYAENLPGAPHGRDQARSNGLGDDAMAELCRMLVMHKAQLVEPDIQALGQ
ncbi:hypothetical protein KXV85_003017 [Aspergillus fumigatus]|nr:hypothetical protein KXV85_003017 [Aspergillus fumigatus]